MGNADHSGITHVQRFSPKVKDNKKPVYFDMRETCKYNRLVMQVTASVAPLFQYLCYVLTSLVEKFCWPRAILARATMCITRLI